ncbi:probable E3 ubiquitin-protein ligase DTX3 [Watersipora subatra]|uniref:probable E3 ubiquitin-protein ligase DTX3 n=1 Tax=Watersipora subatra TaxID=2589382 RepID=UPI00355C47CA
MKRGISAAFSIDYLTCQVMASSVFCPICMDCLNNPRTLPCSHQFCEECVNQLVSRCKSHLCPTCRVPFREAEGKQPRGGTMTTTRSHNSLPGYEGYGCITIQYNIPPGIQGPEHPHPGIHFAGTSRVAYLPDTDKGRKVENLLRKAFDRRLIFCVGQSITTGIDNSVVWNDIHHKTNTHGGSSSYGYPDAEYLDRVIDDLKAKGISY